MPNKNYVSPLVRVGIMILGIIALFLVTKNITGTWIPKDAFENMIFQGILLSVIFCTTIQEYFYTSPTEAMVNGLIGMMTMFPVFNVAENKLMWWLVFLFCTLIFVVGVTHTIIKIFNKKSKTVNSIYNFLINLGRGRVLFSVLFIYGLFSTYIHPSREFTTLILFWGIYIVIWPLKIPNLISNLLSKKKVNESIGRITRTDWPNIIHVEITNNIKWSFETPKLFQEADGNQCLLIPLYRQNQGERIIGTGIFGKFPKSKIEGLKNGCIYEVPDDVNLNKKDINLALNGDNNSELIGFISPNSEISEIKFEVTNFNQCFQGEIIWCPINDEDRCYYQIINGITEEEGFENNRIGYQIASARQLGVISKEGFEKYSWLPKNNTPVFTENKDFGNDFTFINRENDFIFGKIPNSNIDIGGDFIKNMTYHTAILGITGSGKTELCLDLIRFVEKKQKKVICIDITLKYDDALEEYEPFSLSLPDNDIENLNNLLFNLDIGEYSKGKEKQELKEFLDEKREFIRENFNDFIESAEKNIATINLKELANTQATLYLTELYLTELLRYKKGLDEVDNLLIVVEEAHTVMPETNTMGVLDYDSKGLIGKISQLALQGRKYGIGPFNCRTKNCYGKQIYINSM